MSVASSAPPQGFERAGRAAGEASEAAPFDKRGQNALSHLRLLLLADLKHNSGGVPDIVLVAAETVGCRNLRHNILDLDRFDRDSFGQVILQASAGRSRKGILCH